MECIVRLARPSDSGASHQRLGNEILDPMQRKPVLATVNYLQKFGGKKLGGKKNSASDMRYSHVVENRISESIGT
jgi:hypothetical protein